MLLLFPSRCLFLVLEEVEEEEEDEEQAADKLPPINAWYFFGNDFGNGALDRDKLAPNTVYGFWSWSNHTLYLDPPPHTTTQPRNISPDSCQFTTTRWPGGKAFSKSLASTCIPVLLNCTFHFSFLRCSTFESRTPTTNLVGRPFLAWFILMYRPLEYTLGLKTGVLLVLLRLRLLLREDVDEDDASDESFLLWMKAVVGKKCDIVKVLGWSMPGNVNVAPSPNLITILSLIHGAFFLMLCSNDRVRLRNLSKLAVFICSRIHGVRNRYG